LSRRSRGFTNFALVCACAFALNCGIGKGLGLDLSEARADSRESWCVMVLYLVGKAMGADTNRALDQQFTFLMMGCDGDSNV